MATHSSTLAWKIPWMEELGRLQSMASLSRTWLSDFAFTFHFHALEMEMATHSSVLAWRIPGTGEPGGLPSMGSHRVGHDWSDLAIAIPLVYRQTFPYTHCDDSFYDFFKTTLLEFLTIYHVHMLRQSPHHASKWWDPGRFPLAEMPLPRPHAWVYSDLCSLNCNSETQWALQKERFFETNLVAQCEWKGWICLYSPSHFMLILAQFAAEMLMWLIAGCFLRLERVFIWYMEPSV